MHAVTYTEARANFTAMLDRVNDDHAPVLITRQRGKPAVLISLEDFNALDETAYLLRNPANARQLLASIEELNQGRGNVKTLAELDAMAQ
jgi:antitoxin YefM